MALLQDIRLTEEFITWSDFLLLLEGQTVRLLRPKNHFSNDLIIARNSKLSILAASKEEIHFVRQFNNQDNQEDEMMASQWKVFKFEKRIKSGLQPI